jgi:putative hydrolase of the HAD superfamily
LKRRGLKVGLVSNITFDGDSVRNDLDRLGLLDLFDAVVLSSEIGVRKPHPRIYQVALDGLGVLVAQAVFVGDRLVEDVRGPQTAGMRAILTHEFRIEEPTATSSVPDAVIDRLSKLPATLDLLPTSTQNQSSAPNGEESKRQ